METSQAAGFSEIRDRYHLQQLQYCAEQLIKKDFAVHLCQDVGQLKNKILEAIPESVSIGIPGSVTIREAKIIDDFKKRGNKIIMHWQEELTEESDREARLAEARAEFYLTSANAITRDGDIINIDGVGNRVAAMVYGPANVMIIAGRNKIVNSIEAGIRRSKDIAAVMNARRVNAQTPCAETGICIDCRAEKRICRIISIMQYRPWQTNITVFLVNKELGF